MPSIVVVCEASADFQTGTELADRIICEKVDWAEPDLLPSLREWKGLALDSQFIPWQRVDDEAAGRGLRVHGHFDGEPGLPDAAAARRAIRLVQLAVPDAKAVILLRDSDNDPRRRSGIEQARRASKLPLTVVVGVAHAKREAWVIAGWDPRDDKETRTLEEIRAEIGFDPRTASERLHAQLEIAKLSSKRVLQVLTCSDPMRECACWQESPLGTLRERGTGNGLKEYLAEIAERLVPLIGA